MEDIMDRVDHLIGYGEWSENELVRIIATKLKQDIIRNINVNYEEL